MDIEYSEESKEKIYPVLESYIPVTDHNSIIIRPIQRLPKIYRVSSPTQESSELRIESKKKIPLKTCFASISLNAIGIILFTLSLDFFIEHKNHAGSLPMLILSILVFTPGIYSAILLYGAIRGWSGYNLESIPSYEYL